MGVKLSSKNGFSIVEVLIATVVLALAICGILGAYTTCLVLVTTSKNVSAATNAAQGVIEEIRSTPFVDIINDFDGMIFTVNDIPSSRGVVYVTDTGALGSSELLGVTVSVCWQQGNKIIGEDANLNGVLDAGEDVNGNGMIDSTVQLKTQVVNR